MGKLRVGVVGCGGAATWHASSMASAAEFEIVRSRRPEPGQSRPVPFQGSDPGARTDVRRRRRDVRLGGPRRDHRRHPAHAAPSDRHERDQAEPARPVREATHLRGPSTRRRSRGGRGGRGDVMVRYQRRFDPAYRFMRETIAHGELGELRTDLDVLRPAVVAGHRRLVAAGSLVVRRRHADGQRLPPRRHAAVARRPAGSVGVRACRPVGSPVDINAAATVWFAGGVQGQLSVVGDLATTWMETSWSRVRRAAARTRSSRSTRGAPAGSRTTATVGSCSRST